MRKIFICKNYKTGEVEFILAVNELDALTTGREGEEVDDWRVVESVEVSTFSQNERFYTQRYQRGKYGKA